MDKLKILVTIRKWFDFNEKIIHEELGYLQNCEKFYDQCIFYKNFVQSNITDVFEAKVLKYLEKRKEIIYTSVFDYLCFSYYFN